MIDYYGPYKANLGARWLGQDAIIVPTAPAPASLPSPLPQGPQSPAPEPPPGGGITQPQASLFGTKVPVMQVVAATVLTVGLIAAAGATTKVWKTKSR